MDFTIPQEFEQIVTSVRSFRERELMPYEHQFLIDGHLPFEKKVELQEKGREKGFWALEVPERYGGAELNTVGCCLVAEELNKFHRGQRGSRLLPIPPHPDYGRRLGAL